MTHETLRIDDVQSGFGSSHERSESDVALETLGARVEAVLSPDFVRNFEINLDGSGITKGGAAKSFCLQTAGRVPHTLDKGVCSRVESPSMFKSAA